MTNALYLKPTLRWRPEFLGGKFKVVASLLLAVAPQDVVDPYQALAHSAARNAFGAKAGRNYGQEIDFGLSYRMPFGANQRFGVEVGAQVGYLHPGDAFDRADGSRMPGAYASKWRATLVF